MTVGSEPRFWVRDEARKAILSSWTTDWVRLDALAAYIDGSNPFAHCGEEEAAQALHLLVDDGVAETRIEVLQSPDGRKVIVRSWRRAQPPQTAIAEPDEVSR